MTKPTSILPQVAFGAPRRPRPTSGSRFAALQEWFDGRHVRPMQAGSIAHRLGDVFPVGSISDVLREAMSTLDLHGPSIPSIPLEAGRVQSEVVSAKHRSPCRCGDGPNVAFHHPGGQPSVRAIDGGSVNGNIPRHTGALNSPVVHDVERVAETAWSGIAGRLATAVSCDSRRAGCTVSTPPTGVRFRPVQRIRACLCEKHRTPCFQRVWPVVPTRLQRVAWPERCVRCGVDGQNSLLLGWLWDGVA